MGSSSDRNEIATSYFGGVSMHASGALASIQYGNGVLQFHSWGGPVGDCRPVAALAQKSVAKKIGG